MPAPTPTPTPASEPPPPPSPPLPTPTNAHPPQIDRIAHRPHPLSLRLVPANPVWPARFARVQARLLAAASASSSSPSSSSSSSPSSSSLKILHIAHVGSTSVPNLPAKDVIDVDLVLGGDLADDEAAWVPRLEAPGVGFRFLLRESAWGGHRFFVAVRGVAGGRRGGKKGEGEGKGKGSEGGSGSEGSESSDGSDGSGWDFDVNLHVWAEGAEEVDRHLAFRDWLRENAEDREAYARIKREAMEETLGAGEGLQEYNYRKERVLREILGRAMRARGGEGGGV